MAVNAGYVASQNKRWQDANKSNDTDLMQRLKNDSVRAGYELKPYTPTAAALQAVKSSPTSTASASVATLPTTRTEQTLSAINSAATAEPFKFTPPEKFEYDKYKDPNYANAIASAKANIAQEQADTGARLRANGQGRSSYSEGVAQQVATKGMAQVETDVLPKLIENAYAQYADSANRDLQVQQANYGVSQDRMANLANVYGLQRQQDFADPLSEAQTTGNYLSGEARQYIAAIQKLKQQAETPGITVAERAGLSQQADAYRAALQGLGVDSTLFGSGVSLSGTQGNIAKAGTPTLVAQGQQFEQGVAMAGLTGRLPDGQQTVQEQQRLFTNDLTQQQFDQDKEMQGLQYALSKQVQLGNLDINQAQLLLQQDDNDRQWASLDWQMSQPSSSARQGMSANDVLSNIKSLYTEPVYDQSPVLPGQERKKLGEQLTTDPAKREQMFLNVVDSGLSDLETNQVLAGLGMTKAEIDRYKAKYGASSGK
ncbi:hypothetical protein [Cohnella sp. 56]|uniref:hypothetical protein n=1 Tax=Cohnella sp. 56 TaxID=3113722 RepID=UPI0030E76AAB